MLYTFHYRTPASVNRRMLLTLAVFLLGCMFKAKTNTHALAAGQMVMLTAHGVSILYGILAAAFLIVGLVILWSTFRKRHDPKVVSIDDDRVSVPRASLSGGFVELVYHRITHVFIRDVFGHKFLHIKSRDGNATLASHAFATPSHFAKFSSQLLAAWEAGRALYAVRSARSSGIEWR